MVKMIATDLKITVFNSETCSDVISQVSAKSRALNLLLLLLFLFCGLQAQQTDIGSIRLSLSVNNVPMQKVLSDLELRIPYRFAYNSELISSQNNITLDVRNMKLDSLLNQIFYRTSIYYSIIGNQIVLQEETDPKQVTISGYVRDSTTGEALPQAILYLSDHQMATYTNNYGFYSITVNQQDHLDFNVSYIGFKGLSTTLAALENTTLNFDLAEKRTVLNAIVIKKSQPDDNVKKVSPGKTDISMERVKAAPSVGGTGDILSTIQMMPGVLSGLDGRPGYFIRGGNTDQNLVQLDEATLYNPVHLLGMVSIFNTSAIKSAYLLKAGFPASFGDHLSSVLDIVMREGNSGNFEGDFQIGTVTSGLTLSGPVMSNRGSFFISARRSTIDLMLKPLEISNYYSDYSFYDVNAKVNLQLTKNDRFYLSFYQGRDKTRYTTDSTFVHTINYGLRYGNQAAVLRWNHLFSSRLFSNSSIVYNKYFHDVTARHEVHAAQLYSGIRDINLKTDLYFYPSEKHKISAGLNYLLQTQYPSSILSYEYASDSSLIDPSQIPQNSAQRFAVYFGDEYRINSRFSMYLGARMPVYFTGGVTYAPFEPRLSFMHIINSSTSLKLSYTHMHQFLNRVASFNSAFPAEIWIGSGRNIKPQDSREASLGLFKNFRDNLFQTSFEVYYKRMGNQALFREGSEPAYNSNMDSMLVFGNGKSYGAELYIGKNSGRLTGWMSYTLSKVVQQFDSLNLGKPFPFTGDRRHSLSLSASYAINEHWKISSNFVFASGSAFTLFNEASHGPYNAMYYENVTGNETNGGLHNKVQNNIRLSPYHRLDVGVTYTNSRVIYNHNFETEWVLSVYNVYAHQNTFFAYCSFDPVTQKPIPVEVSFIPVLPSLSFYLKF